MRIKMQGFIVFDFLSEYQQAREELAQWYKAGKIKVEQTVIPGGLEVADKAFYDLFKGVNTGKSLGSWGGCSRFEFWLTARR